MHVHFTDEEKQAVALSETDLDNFLGLVPGISNEVFEEYLNRCKMLADESGHITYMLMKYSNCNNLSAFQAILSLIREPRKIWNFCANHLNFDPEHAPSDVRKLNMLLEFVKRLQQSLEARSAQTGRVDLDTTSEEWKRELERYLTIADFISESDEVSTFISELNRINQISGQLSYTPFGVICASSGKGKTNMAFSFKIPYLYFILNTTCTQKIYEGFTQQSEQFKGLVKKDYKRFMEEMSKRISKGIYDVEVESVVTSKLKYESVGFLVKLIKIVVAKMNSDNLRYSIQAQSSLSGTFYFEPMNFEKAQWELRQILPIMKKSNGEPYYTLPIFFDECDNIGQRGEFSEEEFLFLRGVLRCMLCNPIFMGTDAKPSYLFGKSFSMGTRCEEYPVWCLLWHQMPKIVPSILNEKEALILERISKWRQDTGNAYPTNDALLLAVRSVENERPLFLYYIIHFVDFIIAHNQGFEDDVHFLEALFNDVLDRFRSDKMPEFNKGQFAYTSSFHWNDESLINRHLASIKAVVANPQKPYYSLISAVVATLDSDGTKFAHRYVPNAPGGDGAIFKIQCAYEPFSQSPFTGFVIAGISVRNHAVLSSPSIESQTVNFRQTAKLRRISVMNAINELEPLRVTEEVGWVGCTSTGTILEMSLLTAVLFASRVGSFKGTGVQAFLNHLCWELDFSCVLPETGDITTLYPTVHLNKQFASQFSDLLIPFSSPMASEPWNLDFVSRLIDVLGMEPCLGITYPSVTHKERADCAISFWDRETEVLPKNTLPNDPIFIGQCKMNEAELGASDLGENLKSFLDFPRCRLFAIAAPRFVALSRFSWPSFCIWKIVRKNNTLTLVELNDKQQKSATKHVMILDLSVLFSGSPSEYDKLMSKLHSKK